MNPMRSRIHVYEVGESERVYDATTYDHSPHHGVKGHQRLGPELEIIVLERRLKMWGGGGQGPGHPQRQHRVLHRVNGQLQPLQEIHGRYHGVERFLGNGKPGDVGYVIWESELLPA